MIVVMAVVLMLICTASDTVMDKLAVMVVMVLLVMVVMVEVVVKVTLLTVVMVVTVRRWQGC